MYQNLTVFIYILENDKYGEWIIDKENDGAMKHPIQVSFVNYRETVCKLEEAIYQFVQEHPDFGLNMYGEILEKNGIKWDSESMRKAPVSKLNGQAVMALLTGAVRAERFCDGALLKFCKDGSIIKWLKRLKEMDEG